MESLSNCFLSSPPFRNHPKPFSKFIPFIRNCISSSNSTSHSNNSSQTPQTPQMHTPNHQSSKSPTTHLSNLSQSNHPIIRNPYVLQIFLKPHFSFLCTGLSFPLSCFTSESAVPTDQVSTKINIEAILVSIDDFFNRNPFFVAGVTFIWLVVIPLTQEYLQKFKFTSAINAFRKLRDDPNSQLLDIRDKKSLGYLGSPNLKILNKSVVQVEFREGDEDAFVEPQMINSTEGASRGSFDGNSMKVAELLIKSGFKETFAIRGGLRGKNGWQEIQETLLPPSVHIYPKKVKKSKQLEMNGAVNQWSEDNNESSSVASLSVDRSKQTDNGHVSKSINSTLQFNHGSRLSSPYPNYPDLKPPSSPTPSKPRN